MHGAIEIENVGMIYHNLNGMRHQALKDINLSIKHQETFGSIGHNGAGKTTLIKILTGLCHPSTGSCKINGISSKDYHCREKIGFLQESPEFCYQMKVSEELNFHLKLYGISPGEHKQQLARLLEEFHLLTVQNRWIHELSKGMRQRLALVRAFIHDPKIIILDEPMAGLDPQGRYLVRQKLEQYHQQEKSIFLSSHILADLEQICDRVALLAYGKLLEVGKPEEMLANSGAKSNSSDFLTSSASPGDNRPKTLEQYYLEKMS